MPDLQMVGCTKCGKNIPGLCRWCPGCGEEVRPLLLSNQPDNEGQVTCPTCGNLNSPSAENCIYCGTPLAKPGSASDGSGQGRGSRISLNPNEPASPAPSAPPAGGRLSRLAQARSKFEADKKGTADTGNDWLSSLRSDSPSPAPPPSSAGSSANSSPAASPVNATGGANVSTGGPIGGSTGGAPKPPAEVAPPVNEVRTPAPAPASTGSGSSMFGQYIPPVEPAAQAAVPAPADYPDVPAPLADFDETDFNPTIGELRDDSTLPEWLKELNAGKVPPPTDSRPKAPSRIQTGELSEGGESMPQWLRDFAAASSGFQPEEEGEDDQEPVAATSAAPVAPTPTPTSAAPDPAPEQEDDQDLPDWLRNATDKFVEQEEGQRDILDWLKGPTQEDSDQSDPPSFGDVDVEERLNFAFGDPDTTPPHLTPGEPVVPPRPKSGLTSILGFSPYAPDEVLDSIPLDDPVPAPAPPPAPVNRPDAAQATRILDTSNFDYDFPPIPSYQDEPASPAPAQTAPVSAPGSNELRPWLVGLAQPTLETPPSAAAPTSTELKPWLVGLELPTLEVAPPPSDTSAEAVQTARSRGTRPFSVGAMFGETDYLSERFMGGDAPSGYPVEEENEAVPFASPDLTGPAANRSGSAQGQTASTPVGSGYNNGAAAAASAFHSKDDLTGQELPDEEALTELLASLPALPELSLDDTAEDEYEEAGSSDAANFEDYGLAEAEAAEDLPPIPADFAAPITQESDSDSSDAPGQGLPRTQRYNFDADAYASGNDASGDPAPFPSKAAPRLQDLEDGKPSTFELPEFLANPAAASTGEPPTWQPLYIPEPASAETGDAGEAATEEPVEENPDEAAELPDFLKNVSLDEIPGAPVSSAGSEPAEEAAQPPAENSWASNWNEDEAPAAAAASEAVAFADGQPDEESLSLADRLDRLSAPFKARAQVDGSFDESPTVPDQTNPVEEEQAAEVAPFEFDNEPGEGDGEDIPPWLRQLSANGPVEAELPRAFSGYSQMNQDTDKTFDTPVEDEDLPDWLRDDPAPEATGNNGATQVVADSLQKPVQAKGSDPDDREIPDWLKDSNEEPASDPTRPMKAGEPSPADLPDWLKEPEAPALSYAPEDFTGPTTPREPSNSAPPVDYSSLLEEVPTGSQFSGSNFFGDVEGPAWLRQSNQPQPTEDSGVAQPPVTPVTADTNALPAWLRTVPPPPNAPVISPAASIPSDEQATEQNLSLADQLERLAAQDKIKKPDGEAAEAAPAAEETTEGEVPAVHLPPRLASAAVLETLLQPSSPAPVEEAPTKKRRFALPGNPVLYVVYILLIAVAIFGLLKPIPIGPVTISPTVQTFYDQIDRLPANSKVLVAFDWDADRSGEMTPLSTAVVQHIMAKRARLVTLSLNPQGPALAARITDELATNPIYGNNGFYIYGTKYVNLGWRSGQEAGLRSLFSSIGDLTDYKNGQRAADLPATAGINSLSDFDLIVELAGDEGSVRAWVEQVGVQPGAHLIVGVPLAVEPVARPYAQGLPTANQGQMSGETQPRAQALLAGLNQTAQYDQLLQDKLNLKTDPSVSVEGRLSAQSLAAIFLIVVIILANVIFLARRRR